MVKRCKKMDKDIEDLQMTIKAMNGKFRMLKLNLLTMKHLLDVTI